MSIAIKDCKTVMNGKLVECNILCDMGKIKEISLSEKYKADSVIQGKGKLALPGAIDVHVHMRSPGNEIKEDWRTGSRAAVNGGVTTVFDMPNNKEPVVARECLMDKLEIARKRSIVNFSAFVGLSHKQIKMQKKLAANSGGEFCGFKLFMAKTTGELYIQDEKNQEDIIVSIADSGKIITVHAEDESINADAKTKCGEMTSFVLHSEMRPPESERSAVERVLDYAKKSGARINLAHLTTKAALDMVSDAKISGLDVMCESTLFHCRYDKTMQEALGWRSKMNPPLRNVNDVSALRRRISSGDVDFFASDHAPHTIEEKNVAACESACGVSSLDYYLPSVIDLFNKGILDLNTLIDMTSRNAAKKFRLKGKGEILKGFDADISLVDVKKKIIAKDEKVQSKCGWTIFDNVEFTGAVDHVLVNGKHVNDGGQFVEDYKGKQVKFG